MYPYYALFSEERRGSEEARGWLVPLLRAAGGGTIVNLASEVALSGSPGLAHYVASKAAVVGLTRCLARELGPDRIRVNALSPGFIATEGSSALTGAGGYDVSSTPLGRVGEPSDLLAYVTGQQDRAIAPAMQRRMFAAAGRDPVIEIDTDHSSCCHAPTSS